MSELPVRAKVRTEHSIFARDRLTTLQLRKKDRMRNDYKKGFLSRLAEKLDPHPYRDARYDDRAAVQQSWTSQRPVAVPRVVPEPGPAELEARRTAIVPGRVIESNEYALEPGQRGIEPPVLNPTTYHIVNNHPALASRDTTRGDQTDERRIRQTSITSIRELRGLIREKYRRDVYVWSKRGVQVAMRPVILAEAKKSDALLSTILAIVKTWDKEAFEPEEWRLAHKIKENLIKSEDQYVLWKHSPPWDPKRLETGEEVVDDVL